MQDERNQNQIIRKDARECFVESLSDAFSFSKAHFAFASYDVSRPAGHRQTNCIHIYIGMDEILEICRKLECGELRYLLQSKKRRMIKLPSFNGLAGHLPKSCRATAAPGQMGKACPGPRSLYPAPRRISYSWRTAAPAKQTAKG